jgi:hypothetical protein
MKAMGFASKVRKSLLDRVSTGSGSDLVSVSIPNDFESDGLTRSLPLPVLTRSKCDSYFLCEAKAMLKPKHANLMSNLAQRLNEVASDDKFDLIFNSNLQKTSD